MTSLTSTCMSERYGVSARQESGGDNAVSVPQPCSVQFLV